MEQYYAIDYYGQLLFNCRPEKNDTRRMVKQDTDEQRTIRRFEKKYNVKCEWADFRDGTYRYKGYKIIDNKRKQEVKK